ncbi:MAG: hypothetical protein RR539_06325 [Clostridium sp.]|uniref:hypothetical protein n=1 Tax=Clostridium sp. TaxID=1506 RepID=UPI002FC89829
MNIPKIIFNTFIILEIISILFSIYIFSSLLEFSPWHDGCGFQLLYLFVAFIAQLICSLAFICLNSKLGLGKEIIFHPFIFIGICIIPFNALSTVNPLVYNAVLISTIIILLALCCRILYKSFKITKRA